MRQQSISLARSLLRPRISVTNANIISRSTPTFVPKHSTPSLFFHKNQIQFLTQHNRFYSSSTSTTTTASSSTPEATQPEKVEVPPTEAAPATTETTETTSSTETASEAATATEVNDNKVQSPLEKIIEQQKLEEEKERQQKEQQQQQKQQEKEEKEEEDDDEEEEEQAPPKKSFFERVFTVRNMLMPLSVLIALGAFYFYDPRQEYRERQIEEKQKKQKSIKAVGAPVIGGSFTLVDTEGRPVTDSEFRGKWMLVYFGFTNCPDICPEEMRKMTRALRLLEKKDKALAHEIVPIFITCDPNRDSIQAVKMYLKDGFHERFVGLTGTPEQIKRACQRYRVYYSAPDYAEGKEDYLVDHSIFYYLMDPYGHFKEYFGKGVPVEDVAERLEQIMMEYQEQE